MARFRTIWREEFSHGLTPIFTDYRNQLKLSPPLFHTHAPAHDPDRPLLRRSSALARGYSESIRERAARQVDRRYRGRRIGFERLRRRFTIVLGEADPPGRLREHLASPYSRSQAPRDNPARPRQRERVRRLPVDGR